jgi:hypothetical protein
MEHAAVGIDTDIVWLKLTLADLASGFLTN